MTPESKSALLRAFEGIFGHPPSGQVRVGHRANAEALPQRCVADLKNGFPSLAVLTDEELVEVMESRGLLQALARAHMKKLRQPRGRGRPAKSKEAKQIHTKRGRISKMPLIAGRSNIRLAELAYTYMECMKCQPVAAAEATLKVLKGSCTYEEKRRLAKLISEVPSRDRDKEVTLRHERRPEPAPAPQYSLIDQLNHCGQR